MAFNVTDIDPYACTHLIYAFAGLDATTNKIISLDPLVDIEEGKELMQFDIIYFMLVLLQQFKINNIEFHSRPFRCVCKSSFIKAI